MQTLLLVGTAVWLFVALLAAVTFVLGVVRVVRTIREYRAVCRYWDRMDECR